MSSIASSNQITSTERADTKRLTFHSPHDLQTKHSLFLKNTIKRISAHKPTPHELIKVFDEVDEPLEKTRSRLIAQTNVALNWNNYELTVTLRLANPDFIKNFCEEADDDTAKIKDMIPNKVNLMIKNSSKVAFVKSKIQEEVQKMLPEEVSADVTDLRIGERLSLPNQADLASLIQNSKYISFTQPFYGIKTCALRFRFQLHTKKFL